MQQFLIPSSTGSSQIINIPVSLLSQSNQQPISFITANGQIFQIPTQLVVHQNSDGTTTTTSGGSTNTQNSGGGGTQLTTSAATATSAGGQSASAQQQTLVINHQGQLISLPVLQATTGGQVSHQTIQRVSTGGGTNAVALTVTNSAGGGSANNGTTPIKTLLEDDEKSDTNSIDDQGPTIANMPSNAGMPHHAITHATTVDGVNLDEIREFAKAFKLRRLALGLTQTQVGQALSATKGPAYSQSAICRFEKLDITPKSAAKIKPVLEKWMQEAELKYADRLKTGSHQNFADLLGTENTKKRKRRTSFTPQALEILNEYFEKNSHPSGNQGADMTMLAQKLNYDREVIRVWFCNKRQALKNTLKKLKQNETGGNMESSDQSDGESSLNTSQHNTSGGNSSQIIVSQPQTQVISVVQPQSTVASALEAAASSANSSDINIIKQEATNNHTNGATSTSNKTVVTLSGNGPSTNGTGSTSSSPTPENDPVLMVVNAISAANNSNNNNSANSNSTSSNPTTTTSNEEAAAASSSNTNNSNTETTTSEQPNSTQQTN